MINLFSLLGYLILLFLVISNLINISLSTPIVIVIAVISAMMMCLSIIIKEKKKPNDPV